MSDFIVEIVSPGIPEVTTNDPTRFLVDAPSNSLLYGRRNGAWVEVTGGGNGLGDAPNNGNYYVRRNSAWQSVIIPLNLSQLTNDSGYLTSVTWGSVTGKPTFHTIATSGNYLELGNKPTIPTLTSQLTNDSGFLNTIAWGDVTNKPVIPSLVSQLTNDSGFLSSVSWSQVTNKPTIPTVPTLVSAFTNDAGYLTGIDWDDVQGKPTFSTVSLTGSYSDLSGRPTIPTVPTVVSAFTNDAGYLNSVSWSIVSNKPTIPASTSQLTNDSGFLTTVPWSIVTGKPSIPSSTTDISEGTNLYHTSARVGSILSSSSVAFLNAAQTFSQSQGVVKANLTYASPIAWNLNNAQIGEVTLTGSTSLQNPTNKRTGTFVLIVKQDSTGTRTLSYDTDFKWAGGVTPTLSIAANSIDIITFLCDGTYMFGVISKGF